MSVCAWVMLATECILFPQPCGTLMPIVRLSQTQQA